MSVKKPRQRQAFDLIERVLLFGLAAIFAVGVVFKSNNGADKRLAKVGITILLISISINDFRRRTVSPLITTPWMLIGIGRAVVERNPMFMLFWIAIFLMWTLHFYGGGDAKLMMGLFGVFPDLRLVWITCGVLIMTGAPVLALKYVGTSPRVIATNIASRFASGALLPTDEELNQGMPYAFAYCLAGAIYLWIFA